MLRAAGWHSFMALFIAVLGLGAPGPGLFEAGNDEPAITPATNDSIENAVPVLVSPFLYTGSTTGFTRAPSDPGLSCGDTLKFPQQSASAWFRIVPLGDGKLNADTAGSAYDTVLAVFAATPGLSELACNDDGASPPQSSVANVALLGGHVYYIEVTAFGAGSGDALSFHVTFSGALVNPVPRLASATPPILTRGQGDDAGVEVAIGGSDFVPGSVAHWNGHERPTRYEGGTKLVTTLSPDDLKALGAARLSIANPAPGGGISADLPVLVRSRADANCNGSVNVGDALFILRIVAGKGAPVQACDPDADGQPPAGSASALDALYVLRVAAGLVPLP